MFITLYGINNIGKSTQAELLVDRLKAEGKDAVYVKYPVYELEPTGVFLNDYLRGRIDKKISEEELQMWFVMNRFQFENQLKTWLSEGKYVVSEDYVGTGIAWGLSKGADLAWLEAINAPLVKEDLAILLDGERFKEASEAGHEHESNDELMKRSREVHLELGERYAWLKVGVVPGAEATADLLWEVISGKI